MNKETETIQTQEEEMEIDLFELFSYLRKRYLSILVTFLVGALAAGLFTYFCITPMYEATSKLYVVSASSSSVIDLNDLNLGTSLSSDYEELLHVRPIFEEIISEEKLSYTYEELMQMVNVSVIQDTRILTITVESSVPAEAKNIANALAEKAVTYLPKLMETATPNIAEYAIVPKGKSSPSLSQNVLLGGGIGLVLAIAVWTVLYLLDDTMSSAEDMEKAIGIMPMTVIPEGDLGGSEKEAETSSRKRRKRKLRRRRRKRK